MCTRSLVPALVAATLVASACDDPTPVAPETSSPSMAELTGGAMWRFGGQDLANTRNASSGARINSANVGNLVESWVFTTGGDVSATPSVDGTSVYFPDWAGNVYSLDRNTGAVNWSRNVSEYTGGGFSRTTPAIHGNTLIFGDQGGRSFLGATLVAVDKRTGDLKWSTKLDDHLASVVTQSPVVFGDMVYVGVSSFEEFFAAVVPGYPCCSFRGSAVALDVNTGQILWKTYMTPDIPGYSGNSVWGPTAAVDPSRGALYVTTGNNYTVPDDELACVAANEGDPDAIAACLDPDNYFDAIVSLDLMTGQPLWATKALPFDSWTVACLFGPEENCTSPTGPDLDFGEGPALFTITGPLGLPLEVVGAGQKSGQYWVLNRNDGSVEWVTRAGPGGLIGGMMWGSATDGDRIYAANANSGGQPWDLIGGAEVSYGFWSAMDAATGEILWQTPDPLQGFNQGPVAVANDVIFACSMDQAGHMYALDATSGQVLWSFASGGSCNAGAAIVDDQVFWGSGYSALIGFMPGAGANNKFYAFELQD